MFARVCTITVRSTERCKAVHRCGGWQRVGEGWSAAESDAISVSREQPALMSPHRPQIAADGKDGPDTCVDCSQLAVLPPTCRRRAQAGCGGEYRMPDTSGKEPGGKEPASRASNLTVAVRVRPLSIKEKARQSWATVEVLDDTHVMVRGHFSPFFLSPYPAPGSPALSRRSLLPSFHCTRQVNDPDDKMGGIDYLRLDKTKTKHYRFDTALGPTSTQTEVYDQTNKPLVEKAVQGYNACCFAYGASTPAAPRPPGNNLPHPPSPRTHRCRDRLQLAPHSSMAPRLAPFAPFCRSHANLSAWPSRSVVSIVPLPLPPLFRAHPRFHLPTKRAPAHAPFAPTHPCSRRRQDFHNDG